MQVGNITIRQLFQQDRRHVVPLYQRPYVWQVELQWMPLWEDIRSVAERLEAHGASRAHFIGAIVLEYVPQHAGTLEIRLVIDGQQRLTTIQLLLEAFYDYCGTIGADQYHRAIERLVRNDDPMNPNPIERFKVWPTNVDRLPFQRVMDARSPVELKNLCDRPLNVKRLDHPILDAYLYFYESISAWAEEISEKRDQRLNFLIQAVRDHVALVVIDVGREDDAQVIFETLNARGTPLLPSDLVKNHLFHFAEQNGENLDLLYKEYWQPFEESKNFWREEIGRGHAKRARIDLFLQNYLSLKIRDEVPVGHLYAIFRETSLHAEAGNARSQLVELRRYAAIFESIERIPEQTPLGKFFARLAALELGTTYPFLMELFAQHGQRADEVIKVLEMLESFLVRRLVCQLNTRSYGRFFIDLIDTLDGPLETLPIRVRVALLRTSAETGRWPDDQEFLAAWLNAPLYRTMLRSRLRMVLEALDYELATAFGEKYQLQEKLTVEHLLPQQWQAHWPLPTEATAETVATRDRLLHTLGNLTLLSKKLNPSLSNGAWPEKNASIREYGRLHINRQLGSQWPDQWDEGTILERGNGLFKLAVSIWPKNSIATT
ncbi:MAG: DUF262 domain-containing protein [Nitrosomonas ureae]